jgi:hypothetical protein
MILSFNIYLGSPTCCPMYYPDFLQKMMGKKITKTLSSFPLK